MTFVDTNYFLRFLLQDITSQHLQAKQLFLDAANNKLHLFTSLVVIFEIYWVLSSFYKKDKAAIGKILTDILKMSFIEFENIRILKPAIEIYQKNNLDLEDAYNLTFAKHHKSDYFKTFDTQLSRLYEKTP